MLFESNPFELDLIDPKHYSNRIPQKRQEEIAECIREQLFLLPVNLFLEWHQPSWLSEEWFTEAARHIEIPYFCEYWGDGYD